MKKFINQPEDVVAEMLEGLLLTHAGWAKLAGHNVLLRSDSEEVRHKQVALISGGGSGHEPAHAGFVGPGMLSAAVAGEVFTSPSPQSVLAAIEAVSGDPGVLLIVKNYTGDRLNFGSAAERARAAGTKVEIVVVSDDVALAASEENAGRRGLAGTVFVHKLAGAAAEAGKSLPEVAAIARAAAENVATMGVSLSAGTVPAVGKPSFVLGESEMEIGLGIHGEPGVRRIPLEPADQLARSIVKSMAAAAGWHRGEPVAVLLNNLGATSTMELAIFARGALNTLAGHGLLVERVYSGTFLSSLDSAGLSLSVLRLDSESLAWLDAPTSAPAWPNVLAQAAGPVQARIIPARTAASAGRTALPSARGGLLQHVIESVCESLIGVETELTELDRVVGDGDLGAGLARGARAIKTQLAAYPLDNPAGTLKALALTFEEAVGGSSGPLYAILLLRAAQSLEKLGTEKLGAHPGAWAQALLEGCSSVSALGGAVAGDRTMLDALIPFAHSFLAEIEAGRTTRQSLAIAADRAAAAARQTADMLPRRGRSSYLGARALGSPDPGAVAAAIWLKVVADQIP